MNPNKPHRARQVQNMPILKPHHLMVLEHHFNKTSYYNYGWCKTYLIFFTAVYTQIRYSCFLVSALRESECSFREKRYVLLLHNMCLLHVKLNLFAIIKKVFVSCSIQMINFTVIWQGALAPMHLTHLYFPKPPPPSLHCFLCPSGYFKLTNPTLRAHRAPIWSSFPRSFADLLILLTILPWFWPNLRKIDLFRMERKSVFQYYTFNNTV